jgi:hypothetical protein
MRRMRPLRGALLLALAACGGPTRIDLEPGSVQLFGRGQTATVHALPREKSGRPVPAEVCRWSISDEKVASVSGRHNEATVTSVGPGSATLICALGDLRAQLPVSVRTVARLAVTPPRVELLLADESRPLALSVQVVDDQGAPVAGRLVFTRCQDEEVCRGDSRGQLWATGAGHTTATAEVEGAKATVEVSVKDVRTDATRPQLLKRGYMEDLERGVQRRQAAEAAGAGKK